MKTRTLFSLFIIAAIFSSCTTTLQQRRVADELYENPPDTYKEEQVDQSGQYRDQAERSKDTLDRKKDRYGYVPHRGYPYYYRPYWYYRDFHPYYPFYGYGYGYPWYGSAFFGYHSYWHSPYYGYYPYHPYYYSTYSPRTRQRKTSSSIINNTRKVNNSSPHTQRIQKIVSSPENKSSTNSGLSIPSDRKVRMPLRTIRATDGNSRVQNSRSGKRMNYIRPSNIQGTPERKYNIMPRNPRQQNTGTPLIKKSSPVYRNPVYRSPVRSVNRMPQIRPSGSTRSRK